MAIDALNNFLKKISVPHINTLLVKKSMMFHEQKDSMSERYIKVFKQAFLEVRKFTEHYGKEIAKVSFTLLRSNLLYEKMLFDVHVYDKDWYVNDYIKTGEIDVTDFFLELIDARTHLQQEEKKFVGKINISDVDNAISLHFNFFNAFFRKMFQYILIDLIESDEYASIQKSDIFDIYTGELYGEPFTLHREVKNNTDLSRLIYKADEDRYCRNYDLRGNDFTVKDMSGYDFRYTDFRECCLKQADWTNSALAGAIFKGCDMPGAILRNTVLSEANFQNADLREVDLSGAASTEGVFEGYNSIAPCNLPLNLRGADMSEAVIERAIFLGTDFTEAKLDGVSFAGTNMFRCKFTSAQISKLNLSDDQLSQIIVI